MNPFPRILQPALLLTALTGPGTLAQENDEDELYVCRDANGEITALQVDPCPELPVTKPLPKIAPPPAVKKRPAAPKPVPKPKAPPRATTWQRVSPLPHRRPATRPGLSGQRFPTTLGGERPAAGFSTPERTWRSFLAATEAGDPVAAAACFTPAALERLGPELPLDHLRELVRSFTRIENEGSVGPYWSIYGVRAAARPKWILFEETRAGEWKIGGI